MHLVFDKGVSMYTTKNLISLGVHSGYTIYLDLQEGVLKKQSVPQTNSSGKIYIAVVLTLAVDRMNLFEDLLSINLFKLLFYLISIFISISVGEWIVKRAYRKIELEVVDFSQGEYEEFKRRTEKYNTTILLLIVVLSISTIVMSIIYFSYPRFVFLIILSICFMALYLFNVHSSLKKRKHFESYLKDNYMNEKIIK